MTTPHECTKSVTDTRELLQMFASADEITIGGLVQSVALGLLRHYPLEIDLDVSALALPGIWDPPKHKLSCSPAASECLRGTPSRGDAGDIRNQGEDDDQPACGS